MMYIKLFILLFSVQVFSQNLVPNSSFENTEKCTKLIGSFKYNVTNWSTPTFGTTDLFNSCKRGIAGAPSNYNGYQQPKNGENFAGFYLYSNKNYREYLQVKLNQRLEKDANYKISFYISLAEKSDFAIKNIDFLLSEKKLNTVLSKELSKKKLKKLAIENYSIHRIKNTLFYSSKSDWTLISMEFKAKGYEQFLTIGNFNKNSKTDKQLVSNKNRFNMSYYFIDLVSLERTDFNKQKKRQLIKIPKQKNKNQEPKKIKLNKNYTFKNVVFNFNSNSLSKKAKNEITPIYSFLKQNINTKILITGYTDNIGTSKFNKILSEKRTKSVADFFVFLGLDKNRISAIGCGDINPIATNKTEEGRSKNRRVVFKILPK